MLIYIIGAVALFIIIVFAEFLKKRRINRIIEEEWQGKKKFSLDEPMDSVSAYWKNNCNQQNGVDLITWRDLSMDDVYQKINYTQTSVGSEYLYNQLHNIHLTNQDRDESFYELMHKNKVLRTRLLYNLKILGKRNHTNSSSFFNNDYKNIKNIWLYILFGILPIASVGIIFYSLKLGILILISSICLNIITYYKENRNLDISLYEISYLSSVIRTGKRLTKIKDDSFKPYVIEINKSVQPIKKILFLERIISLGKGTGDFEGLFEYIRIIFLLDFISYFYMIRMIQKHRDRYEKLWKTIGKIDSGIAVAFYRHYIDDYCTPAFLNSEELIFNEMYHPLIKNPVKNSSHLNKLTLITGSNASGKSTYMKAAAINAILAQTIHTVHASSWSMKPAYVLSSMAIQDNVIDGDSYFKAEIKSLKRIIQTADSGVPCLSFIDEILRGTNTVERIAASASIMEWLRKHQGMTMVASHDIELTKMAVGFTNYHFHESVQEDSVYFDYKIHSGPSTTKNAIKLLEQMEYPTSVTELAYSLADRFEEKGEWNVPVTSK
ncbi:MutS domain V [Bacillus sp. OV322]|nr:MutS domain V [Bacillus sp. OV322]